MMRPKPGARPTTANHVGRRPVTAVGGRPVTTMDGTQRKEKRTSSLVAKVADEAFQRFEEAWFVFHRHDTDNSGTIDAAELAAILSDLKMHVGRASRSENEMKQWVQRELHKNDMNGDGMLHSTDVIAVHHCVPTRSPCCGPSCHSRLTSHHTPSGVLSFDEFLKYYNSFVSRHRSQWDELYCIHHGDQLGQGAFGVVLKGERLADKAGVAIKRLRKAGLRRESTLRLLHNEIAIWEALAHPHLVQLMDVFEDPEYIILITELMRGGDLFARLHHQPDGRFAETQGTGLMRQIISAVEYLHTHGVVHCDLKPSNILVVEPMRAGDECSHQLTLKVADFGLSQTIFQSPTGRGAGEATGADSGECASAAAGGEVGSGSGGGAGGNLMGDGGLSGLSGLWPPSINRGGSSAGHGSGIKALCNWHDGLLSNTNPNPDPGPDPNPGAMQWARRASVAHARHQQHDRYAHARAQAPICRRGNAQLLGTRACAASSGALCGAYV